MTSPNSEPKVYELAREGEISRDGRIITYGALSWIEDEFLPVFDYRRDKDGKRVEDYDSAMIVGRISSIHRDGNKIFGTLEMMQGQDYPKCLTVDCDQATFSPSFDADGNEAVRIDAARLRGAFCQWDPKLYIWGDGK